MRCSTIGSRCTSTGRAAWRNGRLLRREANELPVRVVTAVAPLAESAEQAFEAAASLGKHLLTNSVDLFDNRIFSHVHSSSSSAGVQMPGGSKPSFLQMPSSRLRITALAMCFRFQVTNRSMPFRAATAT